MSNPIYYQVLYKWLWIITQCTLYDCMMPAVGILYIIRVILMHGPKSDGSKEERINLNAKYCETSSFPHLLASCAWRNMYWHRFWHNPSSPRGWSGWFRCYSLANSLKDARSHHMLTTARYVGMQRSNPNMSQQPCQRTEMRMRFRTWSDHLVRVNCNFKHIRTSSWNIQHTIPGSPGYIIYEILSCGVWCVFRCVPMFFVHNTCDTL